MDRPHHHLHWPGALKPLPDNDLLAPATQFVGDSEAYLGQACDHVGRRVTADQVELFVDSDAANALHEAFLQHAAGCISLHGVSTHGARQVLDSMCEAAGAPLQRLVLRHRGDGAALVTVPFVEVPQANGQPVRVYGAPVGGDPALELPLALTLLGHGTLAVLLLGDLPAARLQPVLNTLNDAMLAGRWRNRELLLVPLGSAAALAGAAAQLCAHSAVAVSVTPRAGSAQDVWAYISGAWNRQHEHIAASGPGLGVAGLKSLKSIQHGTAGHGDHVPTDITRAVQTPRVPLPEAPTELMQLDTLWMDPGLDQPRLPRFAPTEPLSLQAGADLHNAPGGARWQSYVDRCSAVKGLLQCCAFDAPTLHLLAHLGDRPSADRLLRQAALLLDAMRDSARALGLGPAAPEATVSTATHHLLLRAVAGHPGMVLVAVLQAAHTNLTLARMQLDHVEPPR